MRLNSILMSTINPCPCKPSVFFTPNQSFGGNYVDSSITNALRYSQLVRGRGPNYGSVRNVYNTINAFGYYAGGPGGSGAPPRNMF
jgi:hypothetical protein